MNKKIFSGAFLVFILDQLSKFLVEKFLKSTRIELIAHFFAIDLTYNTGGAFSILSNHILLLIIVSIASLFIIYQMSKDIPNMFLKNLTFSLIYGGIIGNLIDRLLIKSVRDFLDFQFINYHFPTFNLADIAIVVGMIFLIFLIFFRKDVSYVDYNSNETA